MQIFLRAAITQRAGVTTDHGPLVRNPLNNDQGEQIFVMSVVVAERIRKLEDVALRSIGDIARHQRMAGFMDSCKKNEISVAYSVS